MSKDDDKPTPADDLRKRDILGLYNPKVFDKQFMIFVAVIIAATALFAVNPFYIIQILDGIKDIASNAVNQNKEIIENQNYNGRILVELYESDQERDRQLGDLWLKFMNAMLVDIEQEQDELARELGVTVKDRIQNNGTHIKFNNDTIEIIKGIPKINITTISNSTSGE